MLLSGKATQTCMFWRARHSPWSHCWAAYWFLLVPILRRRHGPVSPRYFAGLVPPCSPFRWASFMRTLYRQPNRDRNIKLNATGERVGTCSSCVVVSCRVQCWRLQSVDSVGTALNNNKVQSHCYSSTISRIGSMHGGITFHVEVCLGSSVFCRRRQVF